MKFSVETLQLLTDLLGQVKISPLQNNADKMWETVKKAREELLKARNGEEPE